MKKIMITAHSGCEGTPDNSMESILKGIELGADSIEIDVRMDPQGVLRLTHNELEDYSDALLLETALKTIAESPAAVNLDLKEEKLLYPVLEAAEAAGFSRSRLIFSGSVDVSLLMSDPTIVQRARIFLNIPVILNYLMKNIAVPESWEERGRSFDTYFEKAAALVKGLDVECINPSFRMMTPKRIAACKAQGIGLSLWTVNEEADQKRLFREDLVNITTRNVASALRIRDAESEIKNQDPEHKESDADSI